MDSVAFLIPDEPLGQNQALCVERKAMPLSEADKTNFSTLLKASYEDSLCIVKAIRKSDNSEVALVCAVSQTPDSMYSFTPLAVMVEGNPFEDFSMDCLDSNETDADSNSEDPTDV